MPIERNGEIVVGFQFTPEFKASALQEYRSTFCPQQILLTGCINISDMFCILCFLTNQRKLANYYKKFNSKTYIKISK